MFYKHQIAPILLACLAQACSPAPDSGAAAGAVEVGKEQGRKLVWSDEFSGTQLDTSIWNFELGDGCPKLCGWGNNEPQIYTDDNHHLEDGHLIITVRKEGETYTSTRITTEGKALVQYGRVECRAKIPTGEGIWPAFWMLGQNIKTVGWPLSGEIDILEYVGKHPGEIFTTLHTEAGHGNNASSKITTIENIEEGFHDYAIEWTKEAIIFFVDDRQVYTFAPSDRRVEVWPFDQPFYTILNVAVGGNFGGPEIDETIFPQEFIIDYVRAYEPL